jgi:hypothetical protein
MMYALEMGSGGIIYVPSSMNDDQFRHLSNITIITATMWEAVILVSMIEGICEVRRWDGLMSHDILTKFHEAW